ncbi:TorF family putative porin [Acinetobacter zhairhuonensis]|uniref:TorF family putative porin n=1 Tax=Acinetobacter sp. A7.4 TaxID=2919921 RepID=UPI001F4F8744|nr:TorF family putative porin [Acinetobacter sp. A7.4]MCJ8162981.1 TorF family putative porin [Acinetobacter sp. A7.4]
MFKPFVQKLLTASLFVCSASAFAADANETAAPVISVTGSMTMATDYRFRGMSMSNNDPAVQGALNFVHKSGAYLSLWASNADVGAGGNVEADFFVGYILPITEKSFLDFNYADVNYPGTIKEYHTDFSEFGVNYNHSDLVTAGDYFTAGVFYSPEFAFKSGQELYLNTTYKFPIYNSIKLISGLGYTKMEDNELFATAFGGDGRQDDYFDYKIGFGAEVLGLNSELLWIDNNIDSDAKIMKGSLVFSVAKQF